jgi:hypothetical protein
MKAFLITIFLGIFAISGCETDFDLVADADPTPVVFCILNQDSTTQYLRLSRSYLSDNAATPPDSPDSLLFSHATKVAVEEVVNGEISRQAFFVPVEMEKDSGFFPSQEHWIYRAEFPVKPETDYRLVIYNQETDNITYSTCYTVGNFELINPIHPNVRYIHLLPDHNLSFYWTKSLNAAIYQLGFILHYQEIKEDQLVEKEMLVPLKSIFSLEAANNLFSYPINSSNFYRYLAKTLKADPSIFRKYLSIDALIISGGEELGYYMRLQEGGTAFSLMDYSNIYNGIGIFSSKVVRRVNGFILTDQSIDTLAYGSVTRELNFADRSGGRDGG